MTPLLLDCLGNHCQGSVMRFYDSDDFVPDASVGYLVRRVQQLSGAALEPVFAAEGLTGTQWSALVSIWFGRGPTCADLARDLGHDKGAMTRLIDAMEERGLLTRERAPDDRRRIDLALTGEGEAVALRCKARVVECWNGWLADWDRAEAATLVALLRKLRDTIAAAEAAA